MELPSRYLGGEVGSIKKDLSRVDLCVALAFPDLYEIGTSHFGMQILYSLLNSRDNIAAERLFAPAPDMEAQLRERGVPLASLESGLPMKEFDFIGISLLYELNFTNILTMLDLGGIPFYARDRGDDFPLVIGGGPCAFNPEPLADFFDLFVIGDGEDAVLEISDVLIRWKQGGGGTKKNLLKLLASIRGVYVPSFFEASHDADGIQHLTPLHPEYTGVSRAILPDLARVPFPTSPIVAFGKPVHDRLRLEIARGCSRGCRFCQAGMIYRPVRERSVGDLLDITRKALAETGYSDISLLSLSIGDYSGLVPLMEHLLTLDPSGCTAISLPSIRAGRLTPELMKLVKTVRKTGFTIAPEAGTQRLRDVINKNISEKEIVDTVTSAFELGWRNIKLYFMMGLPTETQEDIQGMVDLARRLAGIRPGGIKSRVNVSVATFIPKAHTPFERCVQLSPEKARENLDFLKQNLRHPGIKLKWQDPEMSLLEGVWARGDRRLSSLLVSAWKKGCRLDGWSDSFDFGLWKEAFEETGIDPDFYTKRERREGEVLPWDHIDTGISKKYLEAEFKKAVNLESTRDCRDGECTGCGICDFKTVAPVLHDGDRGDASARTMPGSGGESHFAKYRCYYSRLGTAAHFGHLELVKIFHRAIRRTGVRVKYSKGFHPSMKLSFDNPLPVGMESEEEFFNLHMELKADPEGFVEKLNMFLPESLKVLSCVPWALLPKKKGSGGVRYHIFLDGHGVTQMEIDEFMALSDFEIQETSFKGKVRRTDLRRSTLALALRDRSIIEMELIPYQDRTVRPAQILTQVFDLPEKAVQKARILKLQQVR